MDFFKAYLKIKILLTILFYFLSARGKTVSYIAHAKTQIDFATIARKFEM